MTRKYCIYVALCGVLLIVGAVSAQDVSFVAIADNRSYGTEFRLLLHELDEMRVNPEPMIPYPRFLVACGDFDPVAPNMAVYSDTLTYPNLPPFYPVVGNHEFETPSDMSYILDSMIPNLENIAQHGAQGTYSFDYGNVHCVVLDQYASTADGEVDEYTRAWLQTDLNATEADHVFVFGHEPAFPRYRHIGDSLDQFRVSRDAFWNMLVMDPRVRAYFCGHTHYYSRMRVYDPATVGQTGFPDQDGGLYQVDCGAAGHSLSDGRLTLVYVHIDGDTVRFRVVTSPREEVEWEVTDEWTLPNVGRIGMELLEPTSGEEVSAVVNISWSISGEPDQSQTTTLYVSMNEGAQWDTLGIVTPGETQYSWDTAEYPDGTRYMLRVVVRGDSGFGMVQSLGTFTVNNPGNGIPEVTLNSPAEDDILTGEVNVVWNAADADGDPLLIFLEVSFDDGVTWLPIASGEANDGEYTWDTQFLPNSTHYKLKVSCTDGVEWVEEISGRFAIQNEREELSEVRFHHLSGFGTGSILAYVIDPDALTDHLYRITFDDTTEETTTFDVFDVNEGLFVVEDATAMDGQTESPLFDGLRLLIHNYPMAIVDVENTGWTIGASDLEFTISLPEIDLGAEILRGTAYPADYEMTIYDYVVDTSSSFLGAPEVPMYFTVWNVTEDSQVDVIFIELDGDYTISRFDEVYILEEDEAGEPLLTWLIFFSGSESVTLPLAGDVFTFQTLKPFTHNDVFEFTPISSGLKGDVNDDGSINILDVVAVVRHILSIEPLEENTRWRADCNSDNLVNILDVIGLVNVILGIGECDPDL
ncbi:MAG: metallophosphoesterase [Gemmatimonadota bacterium]|nr:MAG: metallophosphoesterase [Gemmatimonadota bacterium]